MKRIILALLLLPAVFAHLDAGEDSTVNGYLLDFGYAPAQPRSLDSTILNFNVVDPATEVPSNVTSLFIRISKEDRVYFSGTLFPDDANFGITYMFPKGGDYAILARFYDGESPIAETTYSLSVKKSFSWLQFLDVMFIIVLFAFLTIIYKYKRKK